MREIQLLSKDTIDQIAAGEVVERPASVVKELTENAIDAGADSISIEIRDGGTSLIRITDNGSGIAEDQICKAFLRHATSKLTSLSDLDTIGTLGFRGEALSSVSAVAMVELITKTQGSLTGSRYRIEGGEEKSLEEVGAPEGSTILVRNLFYNTPARKKFLKSPATETGYITEAVERLALSHPEISFQLTAGGSTKLHTSGNGSRKDVIYSIYGKSVSDALLEVDMEEEGIRIEGYIGKPAVSRGNRAYETCFVNGRYVRNPIVSKAIEEGYGNLLMQHRYPFTVLFLTLPGNLVDVNVHPAKLEVRFSDGKQVFALVSGAVRESLAHREYIVPASPASSKEERSDERAEEARRRAAVSAGRGPEPFEKLRQTLLAESQSPYQPRYAGNPHRSSKDAPLLMPEAPNCPKDNLDRAAEKVSASGGQEESSTEDAGGTRGYDREQDFSSVLKPGKALKSGLEAERELSRGNADSAESAGAENAGSENAVAESSGAENAGAENAGADSAGAKSAGAGAAVGEQMSFLDDRLLSRQNVREHRIIGQLFDTYWMVQFRDNLYIIDQHAAHEKVNYEKLRAAFAEHSFSSQQVSPPIIVTLTPQEENLLQTYYQYFERVGFEVEPFGGRDYQISAAPDELLRVSDLDLFTQLLDSLADLTENPSDDLFTDRLATMACKRSVKGGDRLTYEEADALIKALLDLEDPYHCPHGRPTIISMSKYDLEKKFKRIV